MYTDSSDLDILVWCANFLPEEIISIKDEIKDNNGGCEGGM